MWNLSKVLLAISRALVEQLRSLALLVLLLTAASPLCAATTVEGTLEGETVWQGEVDLTSVVKVSKGAHLRIEPGTVVRPANPAAKLVVLGALEVKGTEQKPVTFEAPKGWEGIYFAESTPGSLIEHVRFAGARTAVSCLATTLEIRDSSFEGCETAVKLVREARVSIENSRFVGNVHGVDSGMKSHHTLRGNRFEGHTKSAVVSANNSVGTIEGNTFVKNHQGVGLIQKYPGKVVDNRFVDNETGLYCYQSQNTPEIERNHFEGNVNGVVNFSFAYPRVAGNRFIGNETAVRNDQFGSSQVIHNLFRDNGTALHNNRKSNPKVHRNRFEGNKLAMFCDYSSYPEVRQNNFLDNQLAVELGIFQSADWEKRSGSKGIVMEQARGRGSKNPLLSQAPTEFEDFVDVRHNFWGEQTVLLAEAGEAGNVAIFYDRHDKPEVVYEGYGEESYRLDWVRFEPWLEQPVPDAGPGGMK